MSEEKELTKPETNPTTTSEEGCDGINEKRLLRKLDLNLIPGVTVLFLLSFMDRSNGALSPSFYFVHLPLTILQLEMPVSRVSPQIHT
jgi:hypothetical protein